MRRDPVAQNIVGGFSKYYPPGPLIGKYYRNIMEILFLVMEIGNHLYQMMIFLMEYFFMIKISLN